MIRRAPRSTHFPYSTLYRSKQVERLLACEVFHRALAGADLRQGRRGLLLGGYRDAAHVDLLLDGGDAGADGVTHLVPQDLDRKSTRLNSSHANISYVVFCLK